MPYTFGAEDKKRKHVKLWRLACFLKKKHFDFENVEEIPKFTGVNIFHILKIQHVQDIHIMLCKLTWIGAAEKPPLH